VVTVDITCDLMDEDESGYVWAFVREARDPSVIEPGALVVVGDEDAPAVAEVIEIVDKPAGTVVRLRLIPRTIEGGTDSCDERSPTDHGPTPTNGPDGGRLGM
jgi:hypothetical protein